jgi:hypothetical protein
MNTYNLPEIKYILEDYLHLTKRKIDGIYGYIYIVIASKELNNRDNIFNLFYILIRKEILNGITTTTYITDDKDDIFNRVCFDALNIMYIVGLIDLIISIATKDSIYIKDL